MEWLMANWGNVAVGGVLLGVVVAIVASLVRKKRAGESCCGCHCGCGKGCPGCGSALESHCKIMK